MKTIGLICEGVSEINIMTRIISKYLGDDVVVRPIEPQVKVKNGFLVQGSYGGWQQVLNHCNDETIENILSFNDYLVVQIDTDTCFMAGYDVNPLDDNTGKPKAVEILYEDIKARLLQNVSKDVQEHYSGRLIFAISINEIECWLLPIYYTDNTKCKTNNCIYTLNRALQKKNLGRISDNDDKNSVNARGVYMKILKNLKNKQSIQDCAQHQYGFMQLVKQLDMIA